jgi:dephospho-CoA kinase
MRRSALDEATVRAIIAAQATRAERLAAADIVVSNSGDSRALLAADIGQLASTLRAMIGRPENTA